MGLFDREYMSATTRERPTSRTPLSRYAPSGQWVVPALLMANVAVFVLQWVTGMTGPVVRWGVMQPEAVAEGQVWRLLTATYLHADLFHLLFNMIGLYFLGPPLERVWGPGRFLAIYTIGGVLGNVLLTGAGAVGYIPWEVIGLGASGSVLTVVGATAVLFPRATVLVFGLLPMTLATFAIIYGGLFVVNLWQQGANYGGDLSHLIGLLFGAGWARFGPWWSERPRGGDWA